MGGFVNIPVFKGSDEWKLIQESKGIAADEDARRDMADPSHQEIINYRKEIPAAVFVEIMYPKPAIMIGGHDFISNFDVKTGSADKNFKMGVLNASTTPETFPINPHYCILPTQ
jgi:hypothetical protein